MSRSVGIEIGSTGIRVVEILSTSRSAQIISADEYPLTNAQISDQELQKIEILRQLADRYEPQTKFVIGLHQDEVSLKHKFFPFKDKQKITKSLPFEMEDEIPLASESVIFDYKPISYRGSNAEVLVVAAPRDEVQRILTLTGDSGIDADILGVESLALGNIFENWSEAPPTLSDLRSQSNNDEFNLLDDGQDNRTVEKSSAYMALHIGYQRTTVLIIREGRLLSTRTLLWGAFDMAEKMGAVFSIPTAEALKAIPEKTFFLTQTEGATKDQKAMSDALAESTLELVKDLKLTLMELKSIYNLEYSRVELIGQYCLIKNLGPFLTQRLELPVNVTQAVERIPLLSSSLSTAQLHKFSVSIGLALEGIKKIHNSALNLRRGDFVKRNRQLELQWQKWGNTVKLAGILFIVFTLYSVVRESMALSLYETSEVNLLQAAEVVAQMPRPSVGKVEKHIKNQKEKIEDAKSFEKIRGLNSAMSIAKRISETLPMNRKGSGVNLTPYYEIKKLDIQFDQVTVEGLLFPSFSERQLEVALKTIAPQYKKVATTLTPEPNSRTFAYTFKVERIK